VIAGYNTDVEHDGVIYHVQTEDKGIETPIVLSLIYSGGAILASKRSRYDDLVARGFNEDVLVERLKRQHRLICAAINAGRIDDLKRLNARECAASAPAAQPSVGSKLEDEAAPTEPTPPDEPASVSGIQEQPPPSVPVVAAYTVHDSRRYAALAPTLDAEEGLRITLLDDEKDFHGGDAIKLQVHVARASRKAEKAVSGAMVTVKLLGTAFRPVIQSVKTDRDGRATISTRIPPFSSGRAAILIKAAAGDLEAETRRVILPG
jgi:hypothetical protein